MAPASLASPRCLLPIGLLGPQFSGKGGQEKNTLHYNKFPQCGVEWGVVEMNWILDVLFFTFLSYNRCKQTPMATRDMLPQRAFQTGPALGTTVQTGPGSNPHCPPDVGNALRRQRPGCAAERRRGRNRSSQGEAGQRERW